MRVVICRIELYLPGVLSLKQKRHVVKSIIERIKARINASVAETDWQDSWQRSEIGVAIVSNNKVLLDRQVNIIRNIIDDNAEAEELNFIVEYM